MRFKHTLSCFTINKALVFSSTVVALKCYPYPSVSIINFGDFKLLKLLNIWIFKLYGNRKTSVFAILAINRFGWHMCILIFSTLLIPITTAIEY